MSTALTYLAPCRTRENLTVLAGTRVARVRFDGLRAVGVETVAGEAIEGREVILAAGAIASPDLLVRSGVGARAVLDRLGIRVVHELAGVGETLTDHTVASMHVRMRPGVADPADGRLSVALVHTAADSPDRNDLHLMLGGSGDLGIADIPAAQLLKLSVLLQRPASVGRLEFTTGEPTVVYGYLAAGRDRARLREGLRLCARLTETDALHAVLDDRVTPTDAQLASDEALDAWLTENVHTTAHSCGTCRMGTVVEADGRVRGLQALRVADLSIVPYVVRASTNATASMIGERIAALVDHQPP
jgi:choline dehydrogenase